MTDVKISKNITATGQELVQNEVPVQQEPPLQTPSVPLPILGGPSVRVNVKTVDVFAMVERLKVATRQQKEEQQQALMSTAIAAVLGRISATNAEQAELLKELGSKTEAYRRLAEELQPLADACYAKDPRVVSLEIKVKELEAAVERMRKTPEEKKHEVEAELKAKEQELAEAQAALVDAKVAALENDKACKDIVDKMKCLDQQIRDIRNKLDSRSLFILTQALRETFSPPDDDDLVAEKAKKAKIVDGMQFFVELLGGAELQKMIAAGKMEYNYI